MAEMTFYPGKAMNPIEAQARLLYARIGKATDSATQQAARRDFHAYYDQLSAAEKTAVQPLLDEILARASRLAEELMPFAEEAERRLKTMSVGAES
jgi:hypothetical protein